MGSTPFGSRQSGQLASTSSLNAPAEEPHTSPSPPVQHLEAIGILKDEDERDIFAWLTLARSLGRSIQGPSDHQYLTRDQVRAIAALRYCEINDILTWLHLARTWGALETPAASSLPRIHNVTPNEGATQGSSTQPLPTAIIPPSQAMPRYCCTLCPYVRPFKNQSDWRKHEREHDTTYICMLKGPREATPQGIQCAFCGIMNPVDGHLLEHNAQACLQGPPDSYSSKRRHDLVNHLSKIHSIHIKSQGEAIAVKWKHTVEKQAWSCGFCVFTFTTFNDRLSHIATQHFERGQTIDERNSTTVIQGLLRQTGIIKAWEEKLASLPTCEAEDIVWEEDDITGLQHELEVGPNDDKSAVDLAEAAYIASRFKWGMESKRSMPGAGENPDETSVATSFAPNQFHPSLASAFEFDSRYQSLSAVQEYNEWSTSDPATQATSPLDYGYSSAPTATLDENNNGDLTASFFSSPRTQSAATHWATHDSANRDPEDDKQGHGIWPRSPGSIGGTEFDILSGWAGGENEGSKASGERW